MIDWARARERVKAFAEGVPRRSEAEILAERASKLAPASVTPSRPSSAVELVRFALARESFGLEASFVIEVFRVGDLTPVPHAPPFVRGLTNRLGSILPVLDLAPFFELPPIEVGAGCRCVLLGKDRRPDFALLVSDVLSVALVPEADLLPLPEGAGQGAGRDFVRGVTSEALIVLDADRILRDSRLVVEAES